MPTDRKYFRDPIHGFIEVSDCALDIVNSKYFQRLRRIKQLGFTDYVFHGAEHSRFGHSLGVYHLARQVSNELLKSENQNIKEEFCLASLLHDIGHHPFSHSFESVLTSKSTDVNYGHENYTVSIIENTNIGESIGKAGLSKINVINLITGSYIENPQLTFLNKLISSDLDLDRIDYLQRDAFYCGVPYGKIDVDRIVLSLESEDGDIVVTEKGLHSVEMYIMARFSMYTQVYTHHTRRAFDIMLRTIFSEVHFNELDYPKPEKGDIDRIVNFDDLWLRKQIEDVAQREECIGSILAIDMLNRNPIRWVVTRQTFADAQSSHTDPDYTSIENLEDDKEDLASRAGIKDNEIFFDSPWKDLPFENRYSPYSSSNDRDVIKVKYMGESSDIAMNPSSLAFYLAKRQAQIIRIYTLREHRAKLANAISNKYPRLKKYVWHSRLEPTETENI